MRVTYHADLRSNSTAITSRIVPDRSNARPQGLYLIGPMIKASWIVPGRSNERSQGLDQVGPMIYQLPGNSKPVTISSSGVTTNLDV